MLPAGDLLVYPERQHLGNPEPKSYMAGFIPSDRSISVTGGRLNVREWGNPSAQPMLLVHGIPTHGGLWEGVATYLGSRARLVAPDMLGYGRSDVPAGQPVDVAAQAGYMLEVMDELRIERAVVVGHDIGGAVAQILAVRHADRVQALGLVDSVCYDSWPIPEIKVMQKTAGVADHLPPGLTAQGLKLFLRRGFVDKDRAEAFLEDVLEPFSSGDGLKVFIDHVRALDPHYTEEIAPKLRQLGMSVAVVWGREDPFQKPHYAERLVSEIPTAELTWIENASHYAPADAPEPVAEALASLLGRTERAVT